MSCCSNKPEAKEPQSTRPQATQSRTTDYFVSIKTGDFTDSATNGPVYIQIFGRDGRETKEIRLKNPNEEESFTVDSERTFQIQADDVGEPQRILIRHEDRDHGWFLVSVNLTVRDTSIRFVANRWLNPSKHDRQLSMELFASKTSAVDYHIELETGDEQEQSMDAPVYVQIYGTAGKTSKIFLDPKTQRFAKGSIEEFVVSGNNVGEIKKVIIGHEGLGSTNDWYLKNVYLQQGAQNYQFEVNQCLSSNGSLSVELTPSESTKPTTATTNPSYTITIQTGDAPRADTNEDIQLTIYGSKGRVPKLSLSDFNKSKDQPLFQRGRSDQFEIEREELGDIESITIGFEAKETKSAWLLERVIIDTEATTYHFQAQCWLSNHLGSPNTWVTLKPVTNQRVIDYHVKIKTGPSGVDANVILCIHGDQKSTNNFALTTIKDGDTAKFEANSRLEFQLKTFDVGKIKKITIGHDDDEQEWFLKSVSIEKNDEKYQFTAKCWLSEKRDDQKTFVELISDEEKREKTIYNVIIQTSNNADAGTDSGVFLTIIGDQDEIKLIPLVKSSTEDEKLFEAGSVNKFQLALKDVGKISQIIIEQDGKGLKPNWHLDKVKIEKDSEIYEFVADTVLDLSMPYIKLIPVPTGLKFRQNDEFLSIARSPSSASSTVRVIGENPAKEIAYKVWAHATSRPHGKISEHANLLVTIVGVDNRLERIRLRKDPKTSKIELQFKAMDVGEIEKILLEQERNSHQVVWNVEKVFIRRGNETKAFEVTRAIEHGEIYTFSPSTLQSHSNVLYQIQLTNGNDNYHGTVLLHIRGEQGIVTIPLNKTTDDHPPFQAKSLDTFTCRTNDVGKIKRIQLEHQGTNHENALHVKKIQINKGNEIYQFDDNHRVDDEEQKIILYPIPQRKEDFVETQLRRLRDTLRSESAKRRRPAPKPHRPFIYNDLGPYYDTSTVEKAIYETSESTTGYYTRLTALRIVEPWEAYGMDYGVNYELVKQRKNRSQSAKRRQVGMMILPPLSLPFGGQVTYVNSARLAQTSKSHQSSPMASVKSSKTRTD